MSLQLLPARVNYVFQIYKLISALTRIAACFYDIHVVVFFPFRAYDQNQNQNHSWLSTLR